MNDVKAFFAEQLETVKGDFLADLTALEGSQVNTAPGGVARTPLDLAYEVSFVNRRMGKRIRGEAVEPFPEGFMRAPEGYDLEAAKLDFSSTMDELIATWDNLPADELFRPIQLPTEVTHPIDLVWLACYHTGYHDGQLNYLQSMYGDEKVHW